MTKPVIVIDFDDTLTAMPKLYRMHIEEARKEDYRVICMTQRTQDSSNVDEIDEWMADHKISIPVYFTNGASKLSELKRLGITKYIIHEDNLLRAVNGV